MDIIFGLCVQCRIILLERLESGIKWTVSLPLHQGFWLWWARLSLSEGSCHCISWWNQWCLRYSFRLDKVFVKMFQSTDFIQSWSRYSASSDLCCINLFAGSWASVYVCKLVGAALTADQTGKMRMKDEILGVLDGSRAMIQGVNTLQVAGDMLMVLGSIFPNFNHITI